MVAVSRWLSGLLPLSYAVAAATAEHQIVLGPDISEDHRMDEAREVQKRLQSAEIIPTVIDDFIPAMLLEARWSSVEADLGNTLEPKKLEDAPSLSLWGDDDDEIEFVIALTDPDAPSRDDPRWSEFCHWIATSKGSLLPGAGAGSDTPMVHLSGLSEIVPYKAPGPPEGTGKHRYVFLAFVAANGTTEKLHLSEPSDRKHWGYDTEDGETRGVRDWAKENGLIPVAANFIYAKHK